MEVLIDEFDLVIDCTGKNGSLLPFSTEEDLSLLKLLSENVSLVILQV
ncbi:hypothetical protein MUB16_04325 [Priestia sp. OVL9]|nr:hypothetical protein [Priestia sp. OVL9]